MNNCYLVFGPEGSGTRLITRILIGAGCQGDDVHLQSFDIENNFDDYSSCSLPLAKSPVVLRRSFPYGMWWPDIPMLINSIKQQNYDPYIVIVSRDWKGILGSQVRRKMAGGQEEDILHNIRKTYKFILSNISMEKFVIVNYENLILEKKAVNEFLKQIELKPLTDLKLKMLNLRNENKKYYG